MSGTSTVPMGDRGRLVIPIKVRERAGLTAGTPLTVIDTPQGIALRTRGQLRQRVRDDLAGLDLIGELIADRRAESAHDAA